ncbi:porin family protein [Flavobacterium sp.]|uniref:porin family protein n=1 Tax=Flavobacterium sp. TaxID=239 RepID=UPI00286DBB44|nr:porin family protein [Flavobacterium sp.]
MKRFLFLLIALSSLGLFSQEIPNFSEVDSLYREDQFYFGISYNFLKNKPIGVSQNSFSAGLNLGFLRDMPLNKSRTVAIAAGLGFSYNNYKNNLVIEKNNNDIKYTTLVSGVPYDKNKLALYYLEVPIEFRWRTSTPESHKFYRIYSGFKFSYLLLNQSRYVASGSNFKVNNNPDINKIQYGVYITSGWNAWNFYVYYGLQDIFKKGTLNGEKLELTTLNFGLMFYVL